MRRIDKVLKKESFEKTQSVISLSRKVLNQYKLLSIQAIALMLLAGVLDVISIATVMPLITLVGDTGKSDSHLGQMIFTALEFLRIPLTFESLLTVIITLLLVKAVIMLRAMQTVGYARASMSTDIRLRYISALMDSKIHFIKSIHLGSLANTIGIEADRASRGFFSLCQIMAEFLTVIVYLVALLLISPALTMASFAAGLIVIFILNRYIGIVREGGREQTLFMTALSQKITDYIGSLKIIKAMSQEEAFHNVLKKDADFVCKAKRKQIFGNQSINVLREPIYIVLIIIGLYFSQTYIKADTASLITFAFVFLRVVQKITNLQITYQGLIANESAYWAIDNKINKAQQDKEIWDGTKTISFQKNIVFENVDFSFNEQKDKIFENLSLELKAKCFNAIIGKSGVGKSTLIELILGFYEPNKGKVFIDEVSLADINIKNWRKNIGYVAQNCPLIHDTIFNNVTMGRQDYTKYDVELALKKAEAWNFVENLPNGLEEVVGEKGQRFSGGQQQRIALARALLGMPDLLILDEATSALDIKSEKDILKTVKKLSSKITVIAISHNNIIINYADVVYEINNKKINQIQC